MSGSLRFTFQAMTASRTTPTLCVLVIMMGPSRKPESSSQVVPVISPLPLRVNQPPKTASLDPCPRGRMAVTPVRTGPSPTLSLPLPEMSVVCPTATPWTSVMALFAPGVPSKGTPRSRARGLIWAWIRVLTLKNTMISGVRNGSLLKCIIGTRRFLVGGSIKHDGVGLESCWEKEVSRRRVTSGDDMENWKRAEIAGTAGTAAMLALKGRRPAAVLVGSVGLAVLASEYPEQFRRIREELPSYVRQGTRFLDLAMKIGSKIEELADKRAARAFEELGEF